MRVAAIGLSLTLGCATARPATPTTPSVANRADCARVEEVVEALRRSDAATIAAAGVSLRAAAGERTLAGEAATDERISEVVAVTCVGGAAAVLVRTDCGNASLAGLAWRGDGWRLATHLPLLEGARPGHCVRSLAQVTAVSLTDAPPRELVVETQAASDDGDDDTGRVLRVARLGDEGGLRWYEGSVALGSFDTASGSATQGRWDLLEELPVPRDLYVEQRPLHGGLAGEPAAREIQRETWRVQGGALVRVEVLRESVLTRPRAASHPP